MILNLARRAHNHNWALDPIVRSLLDTDFYKLLMLQYIWKHFRGVQVTFSVMNRQPAVRLAEQIDIDELRAQLEHVRGLRLKKSELVWLAGNTFYGVRGIFEPAFLDWLENEFQLPDFVLDVVDGQVKLEFSGEWAQVTLWEIYALSILSEMKTRYGLRGLNELELDILYARAKTRLWEKIERMRGVDGLRIADFGTRRRHSFLWHEYVVNAMHSTLGPCFTGTSNTYLAYKHDMEAIGTNAHELPMALAAMANNDEELLQSQYKVLELWQQTYGGALLVLLPDTYGSTQFFRNAPDWVAAWTGLRIDSKDPFAAGEEYITWLRQRGQEVGRKRLIASDGLDVEEILALHQRFHGRIRFSAGWGTLLTNDFRDCHPRGEQELEPLGLICKLQTANGRPAVKLSDNYQKATGPAEEVARYRKVFGVEGVANVPVIV